MTEIKPNTWTTGNVNGTPVKYRIQPKSSSLLMKVISWCLFWQRQTFMTNYYTTIGRTMYVPPGGWDTRVMEHELIHVYDYQANPVWFVLSYLFCLPLGWTMRSHWERRAYSWNIRAHGWTDIPWIQHQFCSATYLWMWPAPKAVAKWVDDCVSGKYAPIKSVDLGLLSQG